MTTISNCYRDSGTGDEGNIPTTVRSEVKHFCSNHLVKIRLVKMMPKWDVPISAEAYLTDQTNTSLNPHPRDMSSYLFSSLDVERVLSRQYRGNTSADTGGEEAPDLKQHYRNSVFQKKPNGAPHFERGLTQSDHRLRFSSRGSSAGENSNSRHNVLLKVEAEKPVEDSRSSLNQPNKLSNFHTPSHSAFTSGINDSIRNNYNSSNNLNNHRSRFMSSLLDGANNKTNDSNLGNSSKMNSESGNRSILKNSLNRQGSKSSSPRRVQFSKVRTVVYFNILQQEQAMAKAGRAGSESGDIPGGNIDE